jgi:hypothetical protein
MSSGRDPQPPHYRVTFFFGPEPVAGSHSRVSCVFNVKKRSWKGGVQVAVEMEEEQLARARQAIGFEAWLETVLAELPESERSTYETRARDHFVQALCSLKLDLATEAGLSQRNQTIQSSTLIDEVDRAVPKQAEQLKASILIELDISQNER